MGEVNVGHFPLKEAPAQSWESVTSGSNCSHWLYYFEQRFGYIDWHGLMFSIRVLMAHMWEKWINYIRVHNLSFHHMHPYKGWPLKALQVFGLTWSVKGHRAEQPHFRGTQMCLAVLLKLVGATLRYLMKMEHTIFASVLSAFWNFHKDNVSCILLWQLLLPLQYTLVTSR